MTVTYNLTFVLRTMVEIEATKMLHRGAISMEERESIANGSGHCLSSTVRDFYQREDRITDMRNSRSLFRHLHENSTTNRPQMDNIEASDADSSATERFVV